MKKKNSVLINKKITINIIKLIKVVSDKSLSLRALILASQCIGNIKNKKFIRI